MASSADIYTDPSEATYLLLTPFDMPIDGHAVWAIAFSTRSGTLITAALSVMLTLSFLLLWNLACFIAVLSSRDRSHRRIAALAVLWNSNDPTFAFFKMARYTYHFLGKGGDSLWGFTWLIISLAVFGGSIALGIVGPSLVNIGTAAPVRPSSAYYPEPLSQPEDYPGLLTIYGLTSSSYIRALGSVEAVDVTARKFVNVDGHNPTPPDQRDDARPLFQLDYDYLITGDDFGLQHGADLKLQVTGSCVTDYSWNTVNKDDKSGTVDYYSLWNQSPFEVPIDDASIRTGPKATFLLHPDGQRQYEETANVSFAVIPWSARRPSFLPSLTDPWYRTLEVGANDPIQNQGIAGDVLFNYDARFWVQRNRPALSCWQQDLWQYETSDSNIPPGTISSLRAKAKELGPDVIKVPDILLELLEIRAAMPMIVLLAGASGDSALLSKINSLNGVMDASANSIEKDMERLVLASYVTTKSTFVDTTMIRSDGKWNNMLLGPDKQPVNGVGDFVLVSPRIQTFSLTGLIIITVFLGAFLIIEGGVTWLIKQHNSGGSPPKPAGDDKSAKPGEDPPGNNKADQGNKTPGSNPLLIFKALAVTDLFRRDEVFKEDGGWHCDVPWPDKRSEAPKNLAVKHCGASGWCRGHLRDSDGPPAAASSPGEHEDPLLPVGKEAKKVEAIASDMDSPVTIPMV